MISALTQKWILRRVCSLQDCLSPTNVAIKLGDALRHTAAIAGIDLVTGALNFSDEADSFLSLGSTKKISVTSSIGSLAKDEGSYLHSSKLVTNVIVSADP